MQIFEKIVYTNLWPIFNTFFPAWVDSPSLLNGSGDNCFQRTARAVRADNNFFSERIAWVTRTDHMTCLFRTDSPSCSRDLGKQIVDDMFDSSFRRFLVSLRCLVPSSRRPGVVVSLFRFDTWHVVSSLRGFISLFHLAHLTALARGLEKV